jgi:hypothetical protein
LVVGIIVHVLSGILMCFSIFVADTWFIIILMTIVTTNYKPDNTCTIIPTTNYKPDNTCTIIPTTNYKPDNTCTIIPTTNYKPDNTFGIIVHVLSGL